MLERIRMIFNRLRNRYTLKFIVPYEYKALGITPLTFTLGVLAQSNIANFKVGKMKNDYVDIFITDISRKTAITIAKEFVFAKAMIIQDAINNGVSPTQLGAIVCIINKYRVDDTTCKMFVKTGEVSASSEVNLKRLCINRGVSEEDELY